MKRHYLVWKSLNTRLILATLGIFLAGLWSLTFYASSTLQEDMKKLLGDQQFATATLLAAQVDQELETRLTALKTIASRIDRATLADKSALLAVLKDRPLFQVLFNEGIFATGADGIARVEAAPSPQRVGVDFMASDFIAAALNQGQSTVGRPTKGARTGSLLISMAAPIRDAQGLVIGAVSGVTDLGKPNFLDAIMANKYGKAGSYLLVSPQYRLIITATDKRLVMVPALAPGRSELVDRSMHGEEGSGILVNQLGEEVLGSAKNIRAANWYLGAALPTAEAFAPISALQQRLLIASVFLSLLAGAITWWIVRRQLAPMLATMKTLTAMAKSHEPMHPLPIVRHDEVGALIGGINQLLDTVRRQAGDLQDSEMRYRTLVDLSPTLILVHRHGKLLYLNPAAAAMFGAPSAAALIGTPVLDRVHPESLPIVLARIQTIVESAGSTPLLEHRLLKLDGTEIRVETQGTAIDFDGEPAILIAGRDVTEQRKTESALSETRDLSHSILNSIAAQIAVLDRDGTIIAVNDAWRKFSADNGAHPGVPAPNTGIGSNYLAACRTEGEFASDTDALSATQGIRSVLDGRLRSFNLEYPCHSPQEQRWFSLSVTPLRATSGGVVVTHANITDRIQATIDQRASVQRFQMILSNLYGGILLVNEDNRVEFTNQEFCAIFSLDETPERLVGMHALALLTKIIPAYEEPVAGMARVQELIAGARASRSEEIALSGRRRYLRDFVPIVVDGQQRGRLWFHRDITEQYRLRESTREIKERMAAVVDASMDAIISVDGNGRIVVFSTAAEKMFLVSAGEAIGGEIERFIPMRFRGGHKTHMHSFAQSGVSVRAMGQFRRLSALRPDGTEFPIEASISHSVVEGQHLFTATLRDIAQRQQAERALFESEERYRTLVEWSPVAVRIHRSGKVIYVNPAAIRMFGAKSAQELLGQSVFDRIHPDSIQSARARLEKTADEDFHAPSAELKFVKMDGTPIDVEVQGRSIVFDGKPAVHAALTDVTERKRTESARASLEAQLRQSQKMAAIGTLAGGIAHDFNNILATILGNADLAHEDSRDNEQVQESLEEIRKAGTRARDLVRQILSFSRRQPTDRRHLALAPVVEEAARLLRTVLPARVKLSVRCEPGMPPVLADTTQMEQVVINLATNASQAMNGSSGNIAIRLDRILLDRAFSEVHPALRMLYEKHPGQVLRLTVSDDGPGMSEAILARIFEPFFTTKPVNEGTGLGLSVVHGIVQAHEGATEVESAPGKGAIFTIYLPFADPAGGTAPHVPHVGEEKSPEAGAGRHILYLDDDEALVSLVDRLLTRRGYRVSKFIHHREALAALLADPAGFDLVVTDYNMPGMSGLEVAGKIRAIRPGLPVAIASGFVDETLKAQAAEIGVVEVIFKASTVEEYCATVHRLAHGIEGASNTE